MTNDFEELLKTKVSPEDLYHRYAIARQRITSVWAGIILPDCCASAPVDLLRYMEGETNDYREAVDELESEKK